MGSIQLLDDHTINQIAAGEVDRMNLKLGDYIDIDH